MKATSLFRIIIAALICGVVCNCKSPQAAQAAAALPIPPKVLVQDAVKVGAAAALGYLEGGKVGAAAATTAQEVTNIKALQSAPDKQPVAAVAPGN